MRLFQFCYELLLIGGILAIGAASSWGESLIEVACGALLALCWIIMNGSSPIGWLVVIATQFVTDAHWARFGNAMVAAFGDLYDGNAGWMMGLTGYAIFIVTYIVHGFMLLPFDLSARGRDAVKDIKIQPGKYMAASRPAKLARSLVLNCVVTLCFLGVMTAQSVWSRGSKGYRFEGDRHRWALPSKAEQLSCFVIGLLWNELMFYWSHRLLHHPKLYPTFHKQHHEFTAPFALAAIYCGPTEMVISNLWPFLGIVNIYRFHAFFTYCWVANAVMGTQTHHSGHKWPWMTILDHQPHVHDLHHELFRVNYGNVGLFDKLCGTDRDPYAHQAARTSKEGANRDAKQE